MKKEKWAVIVKKYHFGALWYMIVWLIHFTLTSQSSLDTVIFYFWIYFPLNVTRFASDINFKQDGAELIEAG